MYFESFNKNSKKNLDLNEILRREILGPVIGSPDEYNLEGRIVYQRNYIAIKYA